MTYEAVRTGDLDIGQVFQRTFAMAGRNVLTLALFGLLLVGVPAALRQYGIGTPSLFTASPTGVIARDWWMYLAGYTLYYAGSGLFHIAAVKIAVSDNEGKRASLLDVLSAVFHYLLPGLGAGFLLLLGTVIGYVFLIIPGVIFSLMFYAVIPAVVAENKGVIESFHRSAALTSGYRGAIFGTLFVFGIIVGIGNLVLYFALSTALASVTQAAMAQSATIGLMSALSSIVAGPLLGVIYLRLVELKGGGAQQKLEQVFA